jgi:hypothetical protein
MTEKSSRNHDSDYSSRMEGQTDYQDVYSEHALTNWHIFNCSLSESVIPTCFRQTTIVPVSKNTKVT